MKYHQKVYHDENYEDQPPIGTCEVCGCDIEDGDAFYVVDDGIVHADGEWCKPFIGDRYTSVTCIMAYIMQGFNDHDIAEALGIEMEGGNRYAS